MSAVHTAAGASWLATTEGSPRRKTMKKLTDTLPSVIAVACQPVESVDQRHRQQHAVIEQQVDEDGQPERQDAVRASPSRRSRPRPRPSG